MPYKCTAGHMTIGWGWNLDTNPLPPDIKTYFDANHLIAPSHAERLLTISICNAIDGCKRIWAGFNDFPMNVQEALVDLIFNMGQKKVAGSFPRFCDAVMRKNWILAANELKYADGKSKLSKWYTDVKEKRAESIIGLFLEA